MDEPWTFSRCHNWDSLSKKVSLTILPEYYPSLLAWHYLVLHLITFQLFFLFVYCFISSKWNKTKFHSVVCWRNEWSIFTFSIFYFGHLIRRMTHLRRPWCWERLKVGGEGDDRGWDGWMASLTQWTWVWVNSGSWWWTGRPGLQFMGSWRVWHDWATELNWWFLHFVISLSS